MGQKVTKVENFTYGNGNTYSGDMKGKARHGRGTYTWADDGCYYTGEWVNNQQNGQGVMTFKNGSKYEGSFFKNNIEGHGKFTTVTHDEITGFFKLKKRIVTTDGPKFPVGLYHIMADIRSPDGRVVRYIGSASLHLFTGLIFLPDMKDPSPDTSFFDSVIVLEPVEDTKDDNNYGVAVVEATPVDDIMKTDPPKTTIRFGEVDESEFKEVKRVNRPGGFWSLW